MTECGTSTNFPFVSDFLTEQRRHRAAQMAEHWLPRAESMARRLRIQDPEAAAAEAVAIILEKGYLDRWSPTGGASLNTYCYRMIELKLLSWRRRERRRASVESYSTEASEDAGLTGWMSYTEDSYEGAEEAEYLDDLITSLKHAGLPKVGTVETFDLFEQMAAMAMAAEPITDFELSRRLGTSVVSVRAAREKLGEIVWRLQETVSLRERMPAVDIHLELPDGTYDGMTKPQIQRTVKDILVKHGEIGSLCYYLSKGESMALIAAVDRGETEIEPYVESALAWYNEHQATLRESRKAKAC